MIRAILAGFGIAVAALFVLLFVSVPGWTRPICTNTDVMRPCAETFKAERVSKREARRAARAERFRNVEFGSPMYPPETARSFLGGTSRFIRGRLVCARNVNAALAARGIKGTGSALAKSFLPWGVASGPVPGAVAVFSRGRRGGHVAIVDSVRPDGTVIYLNPSSRRQAWQVGPYNRRPIAFRVAG